MILALVLSLNLSGGHGSSPPQELPLPDQIQGCSKSQAEGKTIRSSPTPNYLVSQPGWHSPVSVATLSHGLAREMKLLLFHMDQVPLPDQAISCLFLLRCGQPEPECAEPSHATEAGDAGELPAGGRGRPGESHAGSPLPRGEDRDRTDPAAPESSAVVSQPLGCSAGTRVPVSRTW